VSSIFFATLRRHMVDVIDIAFDLASEEIKRPAPGARLRENASLQGR
jgi:protein-L-isoaspartate(D-aspartate) O-methyltransferase